MTFLGLSHCPRKLRLNKPRADDALPISIAIELDQNRSLGFKEEATSGYSKLAPYLSDIGYYLICLKKFISRLSLNSFLGGMGVKVGNRRLGNRTDVILIRSNNVGVFQKMWLAQLYKRCVRTNLGIINNL